MLSTLPEGKPVASSAFSTRFRSSLFWAKSLMMLKWSRPEQQTERDGVGMVNGYGYGTSVMHKTRFGHIHKRSTEGGRRSWSGRRNVKKKMASIYILYFYRINPKTETLNNPTRLSLREGSVRTWISLRDCVNV